MLTKQNPFSRDNYSMHVDTTPALCQKEMLSTLHRTSAYSDTSGVLENQCTNHPTKDKGNRHKMGAIGLKFTANISPRVVALLSGRLLGCWSRLLIQTVTIVISESLTTKGTRGGQEGL